MRIIINILLVAVILLLSWMLINSIREPIAFKAEKVKRERAVSEKLTEIRSLQEMFRSIKGGFAPTFDSLSYVLTNDSFKIVNIEGDPDDPNFQGEIIYDTTYLAASDSIGAMGVNLDSISFVPYGEGERFLIQADTITYQKVTVPVVQVGIQRKVFMGPFASPRFAKYDQAYNPNSLVKFGDMSKPNLSGNWEN